MVYIGLVERPRSIFGEEDPVDSIAALQDDRIPGLKRGDNCIRRVSCQQVYLLARLSRAVGIERSDSPTLSPSYTKRPQHFTATVFNVLDPACLRTQDDVRLTLRRLTAPVRIASVMPMQAWARPSARYTSSIEA